MFTYFVWKTECETTVADMATMRIFTVMLKEFDINRLYAEATRFIQKWNEGTVCRISRRVQRLCGGKRGFTASVGPDRCVSFIQAKSRFEDICTDSRQDVTLTACSRHCLRHPIAFSPPVQTFAPARSLRLAQFIQFFDKGYCLYIVKLLHHKPEGCGFDSRWCHWSFSLI
jgi:hypothetical protein